MLPVFVVTSKADQTTGGGTIAGGGMFFGFQLPFCLTSLTQCSFHHQETSSVAAANAAASTAQERSTTASC